MGSGAPSRNLEGWQHSRPPEVLLGDTNKNQVEKRKRWWWFFLLKKNEWKKGRKWRFEEEVISFYNLWGPFKMALTRDLVCLFCLSSWLKLPLESGLWRVLARWNVSAFPMLSYTIISCMMIGGCFQYADFWLGLEPMKSSHWCHASAVQCSSYVFFFKICCCFIGKGWSHVNWYLETHPFCILALQNVWMPCRAILPVSTFCIYCGQILVGGFNPCRKILV